MPMTPFKGHMGEVNGLSFSPDGRRLASASQDQTIRLWDVATGQETLVLREHTHRVNAVAFSPDGRRLASASLDGTVRVWDAALRPKTLTFEGHADQVPGLAFSPDGRQIASASADGTIKVWEAATGQEARNLVGHMGPVLGVAFSADGRIASGGQDGTVRVWDAALDGRCRTFHGHTGAVWGVAFRPPDGRWVASASEDGTLRASDAATGQEIQIFQATDEFSGVPTRPVFSPDGKLLACARNDQTVKVWDVETGQETVTFRQHKNRVIALAFSPDGKHLASGSDDQTVRVWEAATGKEVMSLQTHSGAILGLGFSPDGHRLASAGGDPTVRVWDTATGQEILTLEGHTRGVFAVAFSPDGRRLASASADGTVKVWDATELTPQARVDWEARGLVDWLFDKPLSSEQVAAALRRDASITEPVRQRALAWVEPFARIRLHVQAKDIVRPLFHKPLLRSEVLGALRADDSLNPALRKEALVLAATFPEDGESLHHLCWHLVCRPDAGVAAYERGLRMALASDQVMPPNRFVNIRGVAFYRAGKYRQALEALALSNKIRKASNVDDLAFLAMTQHQLGQEVEAQATLARLRKVMQQPNWARNGQAQAFLREAEELLETKRANGPK
jgi:WD40 repeat protein